MKINKQEIIDRVNKNDYGFIYDNYYEWNITDELKDVVKTVYEQSWGDGNDYDICFYFVEHDLYVLLNGTYSSHDSPYWDSVSFAEPFEFKETRYKKATLEYLRDKKIENVLKK